MAAVLIIAGVLPMIFFLCSRELIRHITADYAAAIIGCTIYEASVLECISRPEKKDSGGKYALVVQFRIDEEKKTVVNSCTSKFYGKYSRGDKIKLLFREEMPADFSIVSGDNAYEHKAALVSAARIPALVSGVILLAAGIALVLAGGGV